MLKSRKNILETLLPLPVLNRFEGIALILEVPWRLYAH